MKNILLFIYILFLSTAALADCSDTVLKGSSTTNIAACGTGSHIDNVPVGATTPSTGKFTTIQGTTLNSAGVVNTDSSGNLSTSTELAIAKGGNNCNEDTGMTTGTSDNSVPLQAAITGRVNTMIANGNMFGICPLKVPSGSYTFTNGINTRPWLKIGTVGFNYWNFSGMSTSGTAINAYNDDAATGSWTTYLNQMNFGPFLNGNEGNLFINGPGESGTSVGLAIGDTTATGADTNFRDTSIANITIHNFNTCLLARPNNLYVVNFTIGGSLFNCAYGIKSTGAVTNSGERISFENYTMGNDQTNMTILYINNSGINFNFDKTSWSYANYGVVLDTGAVTTTSKHDGWIEGIQNQIVQSNLTAANGVFSDVRFSNEYIVPTSLTSTQNRPNRALFTGYFNLYLHDVKLGGWPNASYDGTIGLFMCDSSVYVREFTGMYQGGKGQLIAQQTLLNSDPLFAQGVNGQDLSTGSAAIPTWTETAASGLTAVVDTSKSVSTYGGTRSILLTETGSPGTNFNVVTSNFFPVTPGETLLSDVEFYGDTIAGGSGAKININYIYYVANDANTAGVHDAGGGVGDVLLTDYNDSTDSHSYNLSPAGGTAKWYKLKNLKQAIVPAGYTYARMEITSSAFAAGDIAHIGFAGVNGLDHGM